MAKSLTLRERLVFSALSILKDEDPELVLAVGDNELRISWPKEARSAFKSDDERYA